VLEFFDVAYQPSLRSNSFLRFARRSRHRSMPSMTPACTLILVMFPSREKPRREAFSLRIISSAAATRSFQAGLVMKSFCSRAEANYRPRRLVERILALGLGARPIDLKPGIDGALRPRPRCGLYAGMTISLSMNS
jgi:hypothetical protein